MTMTELFTVGSPKRFAWTNGAIGIALILAGIFVLGDVMLATVISAMVLGVAIVCVGLFEMCIAVWAGGWRGFLWQVALGIFYIVVGCALISMPVQGSKLITAILGAALVGSGLARMFVGMRNEYSDRWLIFVSGLFALTAGLLILIGWPSTGLWVIGAFLGIDLILHGVGWLAVSRRGAADIQDG